jgi:hypothetical protein
MLALLEALSAKALRAPLIAYRKKTKGELDRFAILWYK